MVMEQGLERLPGYYFLLIVYAPRKGIFCCHRSR